MDTVWTIVRVVVAFGVVITLMWWLSKRTQKLQGRAKGKSLVQVRARQNLGQKTSVVVLDVNQKRYVLGVGDGNVTVIDKTKVPDDFAAELEKAAQAESATTRPAAVHPAPPTAGMPGERPTFLTALGVGVRNQFGMKK